MAGKVLLRSDYEEKVKKTPGRGACLQFIVEENNQLKN